MAAAGSIMLCILRLCRKQIWLCSSCACAVPPSGPIYRSQRSSATLKAPKVSTTLIMLYTSLYSELHRDFSDQATLNGCSFKMCDFPDLQRPDMPELLSVSATEEQADEQSAMATISLLTESASSDAFCICSCLLKLHYIIRWRSTRPEDY